MQVEPLPARVAESLPRAEVERALAEVYARPELNPPPPSALSEWFTNLWVALWDWIRSLLPTFSPGEGALRLLAWLAGALLVVAAVVALLHLTRSGSGWWRVFDRRHRDDEEATGSSGTADWDARARALAEAGRWREAALALYQALVLRLDAQGAVRYDASKTPGDYRREARKHPGIARVLDAFIRSFEPAAFGSRDLDAAGFRHLQALANEVHQHG